MKTCLTMEIFGKLDFCVLQLCGIHFGKITESLVVATYVSKGVNCTS